MDCKLLVRLLELKMKEYNLPKWPCLIVTGKKVTEEQAAEIIIRTNRWHGYTGNDDQWNKIISEATGIKLDKYECADFDSVESFKEEYNVLDLGYLHTYCISTSYVGGPHGWCNWFGNIFSNSHNIGKWPNAEEILEEWSIIADAFPYLDLRSQLYSGEQCEENTYPVVEYVVKDGKAIIQDPTFDNIRPVYNDSYVGISFLTPVFERGCSE